MNHTVGSPGSCNHSPALPDSLSEVREQTQAGHFGGCPGVTETRTKPWSALYCVLERLCLTPDLLRTEALLLLAMKHLQVAEPTLAKGTQRFVLLDGAAPKLFPCLGAFPDPFSLGEALGWALGAGKGKQRDRGWKQQEERREPRSQQWKIGIDQEPVMLGWWCYPSACALMGS